MHDVAAALVKEDILTPQAMAQALAAASDGDVASAALRLGLAEEGALVRVLARVHACPGIDLSRSVVPTGGLGKLSPAFCRSRKILPISTSGSDLVLAMADPGDRRLADEVRFVTGRKVLRYVAVGEALTLVLEALLEARKSGAPAWRGPNAPRLADPAAACMGVVQAEEGKPPRPPPPAAVDLPESDGVLELVSVASSLSEAEFAPLAQEEGPSEAAPPVVPPATEGGPGAGKLVLVADDDADARRILERLLTSMGCAVMHAADGRAALEAARRARPHLVVLDGMMPMVHGFEVCRAIKGDPTLRRTPVVLFSAVYRGIVASDAMEAFGADHFLDKPFRLEEARRVFTAALSGGAAPEDPGERARLESAAAEWKKGARALSEGRVTEAIALCRRAVALDRFSAEGHYHLGLALRREGQLFEAAAELEQATELRPEAAGPHQMLAQTYEQLGFRKTACQFWARAIESSHDPERKKAMQAHLVSLLSA